MQPVGFLNHGLAVLLIVVGLLSGILSVLREVQVLYFPAKTSDRKAFWAFVRTAFIVAACMLWFDEHEKVNELSVLSQPKIDIKAIRGGTARNTIDSDGGSFFYAELMIANQGKATGLTPWVVSVKDGDKWMNARVSIINGGPLTLGGADGKQTLPARDKFLPDITMRPIERGAFVSGYIMARFDKDDSFFENKEGRQIKIAARDIFGKEWATVMLVHPGALNMRFTTPGLR